MQSEHSGRGEGKKETLEFKVVLGHVESSRPTWTVKDPSNKGMGRIIIEQQKMKKKSGDITQMSHDRTRMCIGYSNTLKDLM